MSDPVVLRNPSRLWTPLLTCAAIVVLFAPPIALGFVDRGATGASVGGAIFFAASAAWFARSAWRAPIELRLADGDALTIGRPRRVDRYAAADVAHWSFGVPDGAPTQSAPATNALLMLALRDGTRFRGEVTSDEARRIAAWLGRRLPVGDA